jgi:hypothetical protein
MPPGAPLSAIALSGKPVIIAIDPTDPKEPSRPACFKKFRRSVKALRMEPPYLRAFRKVDSRLSIARSARLIIIGCPRGVHFCRAADSYYPDDVNCFDQERA